MIQNQREQLLEVIQPSFKLSRGLPIPFGPTLTREGINFAVFSKNATQVILVIFATQVKTPLLEIPLDPRFNKTGDVWHVHITGLDPGIEYGYRVERQPNDAPLLHRYDSKLILIDPYVRALSGGNQWGEQPLPSTSHSPLNHRHSLIARDYYDWEDDQPLNIHLADSIIYELHVRGFTHHPSARVSHPGTFSGLIEKIPYLQELGITAVELLPINEFDETHNDKINPVTGKRLFQYWGYDSIAFFAPKASYATSNQHGDQIKEFKDLVKALHRAGIEVILDIVFNHTAEGDAKGTTFSFRGLDNSIYYLIDKETGQYHNFSGCGNTLNCNHPVVRDLILDCLRYWVVEMHVDGFRFDLAAILGRGQDGIVLANPPLLEHIAADPVLANTKIIAEAWDAAGLYQVGSFPAWQRWAEWNGKFRDDVRRYIRGDKGMVGVLATRLAGSSDLYQQSGRAPYHSINFITSHDGFTLHDLVTYNRKYNLENGENNQDGSNDNFSWNCGKEGPTQHLRINKMRKQQIKNMSLLLLLAQGVPMILGGDEMGRTQRGNNNAYCQDNEISWLNWQLLQENVELFHFFKNAIRFRKDHPALRRRMFFNPDQDGKQDISWHGLVLNKPDWSSTARCLAFHLGPYEGDYHHLYIISNTGSRAHMFPLPATGDHTRWYRVADTAAEYPHDFYKSGHEKLLEKPDSYTSQPRSTVLLISK
jgi:isoamylase